MTYRQTPIPDAPTIEEVIENAPDTSWDEQLRIFQEFDSIVSIHSQTPHEVIIEIKTEVPVSLTIVEDIHLGAPGFPYDEFGDDMRFLRDEPGMFVEVGGDGYQNIIQPSKVGSSHNQMPISAQRGLFVLTLKELKDKIKVLRTGNHNYWSTTAVGEDWEQELARRMKLLYMKHRGIIHWKIGSQVYTELAMHQARFNSSFNLTHTCKQNQRMYCPEARIITVAHTHVPAIEQYSYNGRDCVAIRPGTYSVNDDRAQQFGYFGGEISNPTVIMFPNEDKIIGFKDMRDAAIMLRTLRGGKLI
jgi:hypothetical protein